MSARPVSLASASQLRTQLLFWTRLLVSLSWCAAAAAEPFEVERWQVTGRPIEAHAVPSGESNWLAIISVDGAPPEERRFITLGVLDGAAPQRIELPHAVVAVDFDELDPAAGPEILTIERGRLQVLGVDGAVRRTLPLRPRLPLPPRTRQLARLPVLGDWDGLGRREALLPDLDGLRVVPLAAPDAAHGLQATVTHNSEGFGGAPSQRSFWASQLEWPRVALADHDGDGQPELWTSDRFGLSLYRRGAAGLEPRPFLRKRFPPFRFEEELRHQSNQLLAEAVDFDGDGRSDLLVTRTAGTVTASRTHAALHRNTGGAFDPMATADSELTVDGGFGQIQPVDLDGDGASELVQLEVAFGVVQMIRIFTRGRADVRLRLHAVDAASGRLEARETWSETVSVPFDTATSRVGTLLPRADGDWNGDGLLDLIHGQGDGLAIRLAERGEAGVRFGEIHTSAVAPSEGGFVADLDGDRLSELVLWNPLDRSGEVRILRNRGVLPGSPSRFEASD